MGSLCTGLCSFRSSLGLFGSFLVLGCGRCRFFGGLLGGFGGLLGLFRFLLSFLCSLLGSAGGSQQGLCLILKFSCDDYVRIGHHKGGAFQGGPIHLQGAYFQRVTCFRQDGQGHQGALGGLGAIRGDGTMGHFANGNAVHCLHHINHCGGTLAGICVGGCGHRQGFRRLIGAQEQLSGFHPGLVAGVAAEGPGNRHILSASHDGSELALQAGLVVHRQLCGIDCNGNLRRSVRLGLCLDGQVPRSVPNGQAAGVGVIGIPNDFLVTSDGDGLRQEVPCIGSQVHGEVLPSHILRGAVVGQMGELVGDGPASNQGRITGNHHVSGDLGHRHCTCGRVIGIVFRGLAAHGDGNHLGQRIAGIGDQGSNHRLTNGGIIGSIVSHVLELGHHWEGLDSGNAFRGNHHVSCYRF